MTSIIFHSDCADGIVSKELLRASAQFLDFDRIDFLPFQYGAKIAARYYMFKNFWVDCCPEDEEDFLKGLKYGCVYIDHHETVKEKFQKYYSQFPDQLIFGETSFGHSGASLTYDYLMKEFRKHQVDPADIRDFEDIFYKIQKFAALADTWQINNKDFKLARAMSSLIAIIGNDIDIPECHLSLIKMASTYRENKQNKEKQKAADVGVIGFPLQVENEYLNIAILNDVNISDVAEILRSREEEPADLIVGFFYIPKGNLYDIVYSLRSNNKFDCSKYAKFNGGGGHINSAGFKIKAGYLDATCDPIEFIRTNLTKYLNITS